MLEASLDAKQGLPCGNQSWRDRLRQRQLCARPPGCSAQPLSAACAFALNAVRLKSFPSLPDILDDFTVPQLK